MAPSVAGKAAPASTVQAAPNALPLGVKPLAYPAYFPQYDHDEKFDPPEVIEYVDPGLCADPAMPNLLVNAKTRDISPYLGTEIEGVQLSQLSKEGLDELALLTAQRKVLVFRDQDFKDIGFEKQIEFGQHFGRLHQHPLSGNIKGYPEFHVVYRDWKMDLYGQFPGPSYLAQTQWHADVTFEKQPAGLTLFWVLDGPKVGGDTLYVCQVEAYKRLSPEFRKRLEGLKVLHSASQQWDRSKKMGGPIRREPLDTEHPLVRVHPVTGEKSLFINQEFTRYILGYKKEESDNLLKFLFDHLEKGSDFTIRATYAPGTVVVWDNRTTLHSATADYNLGETKERRHAVRLMCHAEVPVEAKADEE